MSSVSVTTHVKLCFEQKDWTDWKQLFRKVADDVTVNILTSPYYNLELKKLSKTDTDQLSKDIKKFTAFVDRYTNNHTSSDTRLRLHRWRMNEAGHRIAHAQKTRNPVYVNLLSQTFAQMLSKNVPEVCKTKTDTTLVIATRPAPKPAERKLSVFQPAQNPAM